LLLGLCHGVVLLCCKHSLSDTAAEVDCWPPKQEVCEDVQLQLALVLCLHVAAKLVVQVLCEDCSAVLLLPTCCCCPPASVEWNRVQVVVSAVQDWSWKVKPPIHVSAQVLA
jgi:hypothetical protein